jgi:inhibitor of KinA sporulation pathway (predicted exonuclease)
MEVDLSIKLVVKVLDNQPVASVTVLVRTHIFIQLREHPKSLCHISACLIDYIRVFYERLSFDFGFDISLVI